MTRAPAPGEVSTVTGAIPPDRLGLTLMHEHLLCDVTPPGLASSGRQRVDITLENVHAIRYNWISHYGNHILDDWEAAAGEVEHFRAAGGGAVVDVTVNGIHPDPEGLRRIAAATDVAVIAGTGFYIQDFAGAAIEGATVDRLATRMIDDLRVGFPDTDIRAGIIGEIGVSDPWTPAEQRVMHAAVVAQQETGASITVHPGRDPQSPVQVARFIAAHGGDLSRVVIGHLDRTLFDVPSVLRLLDEGVVAEWDFFGIESSYYPFAAIDMPNDGQRLQMIGEAIDAGFLDRIAISHDICTRTRLQRWGGHGYAHIPRDVLPMMRRKGFGAAEIQQILVATPARLLTLR